ncbi:Uncharacterised protein [Mycobacteroides abscessus subsp. massiliense]|nr:Uncharacterised protein [Mycobacteroides abscessus subsp. massiliense]
MHYILSLVPMLSKHLRDIAFAIILQLRLIWQIKYCIKHYQKLLKFS